MQLNNAPEQNGPGTIGVLPILTKFGGGGSASGFPPLAGIGTKPDIASY